MVSVYFAFYLLLIIIQRISEMKISKRNEKILIQKGALEFGRAHFKFIIMTHILFLISMAIEYFLKSDNIELKLYNIIFFGFVILFQILRFSIMKSLGIYRTMRIYRIPGGPLVKTGLYKYFRHPNYMIVILEIIIIPLVFNLYLTSIIFTLLNSIILTIRISEENKALNI